MDWIYNGLFTFFTRQKHRYYKEIQNRYWYFDVKGFSTQGPYNLDLEEVFVELKVAPMPFQDASSNPIKEFPPELRKGSHPIWNFINNPVMSRQNLSIIGAPGCGKTTLAKHGIWRMKKWQPVVI